jgi:phosphoglycerate dehydrogenase-like enzyme
MMQRMYAQSSPRPVVLVTEGLDSRPLVWLQERAEVRAVSASDPGFAEALHEAEGLIVRTYTRVTETLLSEAPRLRVIGRAGVGVDNIDLPACRRRGVVVVNTPDANTLAVGDFVFGCMIQLVRGWVRFDRQELTPEEFIAARSRTRGRQLNELTLGILGMGRVGRRVGAIAARGFGMRVLYNDLLDVKSEVDFPASAVEKDVLYAGSNVLSIHVDLRPGNEKLVGKDEIRALPPGAILINTSRGEVLDVDAVAEALRDGHLFGAALDVFAPEPPPKGFPLVGMPNVILTPHLASRTSQAVENMSWVVRDVVAVLCGLEPEHPV